MLRGGNKDPRLEPLTLPTGWGVDYNRCVKMLSSIDLQRYVFPAFLAMASVAVAGASCDRKSPASPEDTEGVVSAMDNAREGEGAAASEPVNTDPLPGIELGGLDDAKKQRFYRLVDKALQSPCGKPHSLRTSITTDVTCKRGPYGAKYVAAMLEDEIDDDEIKMLYQERYKERPARSFQLRGVPVSGPEDAPVKVVEFYDYGCPACKQFAPALKLAAQDMPGVAVFYKQFPLAAHKLSAGAAQAALAAHKQGKFEEMHALLFARMPAHQPAELEQYAQSLGLDMARFKADYAAAAPVVQAEVAEGDAAGVEGTPTLFINGRRYSGLAHPRYLKMWFEEELAVNR